MHNGNKEEKINAQNHHFCQGKFRSNTVTEALYLSNTEHQSQQLVIQLHFQVDQYQIKYILYIDDLPKIIIDLIKFNLCKKL